MQAVDVKGVSASPQAVQADSIPLLLAADIFTAHTLT
jgi:hypothetical protein